MAVCDICNAPGTGTLVSSEQMRVAVFTNGFDPFSMGLVGGGMHAILGISTSDAYQNWKNTVVAQDSSDWNVCSSCLSKLRPYLGSAPESTGVKKSRVSSDPFTSAAAGAAAEHRYKKSSPGSSSPGSAGPQKKWWQFWK